MTTLKKIAITLDRATASDWWSAVGFTCAVGILMLLFWL